MTGMAHADTITTLTAGNFTFAEDQCGDAQPGFSQCLGTLTVSAGVATTGPYVGDSFISFNDNGTVRNYPNYFNFFTYTVTYNGSPIPTNYSVALEGGAELFGAPTIDFAVGSGNGGPGGGFLYPGDAPFNVSYAPNGVALPLPSFYTTIEFGTNASTSSGPEAPEAFTLYYQANPAPEPGLMVIPGLCLVAGLVIRHKRLGLDVVQADRH
jgi:hypothetical protein